MKLLGHRNVTDEIYNKDKLKKYINLIFGKPIER